MVFIRAIIFIFILIGGLALDANALNADVISTCLPGVDCMFKSFSDKIVILSVQKSNYRCRIKQRVPIEGMTSPDFTCCYSVTIIPFKCERKSSGDVCESTVSSGFLGWFDGRQFTFSCAQNISYGEIDFSVDEVGYPGGFFAKLSLARPAHHGMTNEKFNSEITVNCTPTDTVK